MFQKIATKVTLKVNIALLAVLLVGGWYLVEQESRSLENNLLQRGRIESIVGARQIGRVIEEAIDNGVFGIEEAFDTNYVPIPGFDPPKYHTRYDSYLDKAILPVEDEFLKDESVVFAVAVDVNGYLPTHNTRFQQAPTGDYQKDLAGNRTKRIFNDTIGLQAARNTEEGFLQSYNRDTGETMWDISSPIYVKGKHWGGFRIGFSLEHVQAEIARQKTAIAGVMAIILLVSLFLSIVVVNQTLRPLTELTKIASDLADGKVDRKIEPVGTDEIGRLADVLERLRVSIKAAMDRLSRK